MREKKKCGTSTSSNLKLPRCIVKIQLFCFVQSLWIPLRKIMYITYTGWSTYMDQSRPISFLSATTANQTCELLKPFLVIFGIFLLFIKCVRWYSNLQTFRS